MDKMSHSKKSVAQGQNVTKWGKGMSKTSGHIVTKGRKVSMGRVVSIFMGKMDVKNERLKCGTKFHTIGLAKYSGWNVHL
jgi:hypothetical protein